MFVTNKPPGPHVLTEGRASVQPPFWEEVWSPGKRSSQPCHGGQGPFPRWWWRVTPGLKREGGWRPGISSEFVTGPPNQGTATLHQVNHVRRIQMPAWPRAALLPPPPLSKKHSNSFSVTALSPSP